MKKYSMFLAFLIMSGGLFAQGAQITSLSDIKNGVEVQFKNVATGQYIIYTADPRGGGVLEIGPSPEPTPWVIYQANGASSGNVEVKRKGALMFNWSDYAGKGDNTGARSMIAYNHAKRKPNNTTPAAPHAWTIEPISGGKFLVKSHNGRYLTQVDMKSHLRNSVGKKAVTLPSNANDKRQQWEIYKVGGTPVVTIYRDYRYEGSSHKLTPGLHEAAALGNVGDNNISSLKIESGWKVILYDGPNGSGAKVEMTSSGGVPSGFNDKASSVRIVKK